MSNILYRSYVGAPRVYLTHGLHLDGKWKRMWYVNHCPPDDGCVWPRYGHHFWTWREAIDFALSFPVPDDARPRREKAPGLVEERKDQ